MHKDTKLAIALQYLALGLKIQPIHWIADGQCSCGLKDCKTPGKHPLTAQGYKDASAMAGQIRTWINRWPRCNLGLTMGQVINGQRLIALDIDPRNGGDDGLAELIKQHGPMPDTPMQLTQSGGQHYLFWTPENAQLPGYLTNRGVEVKTKNHINIYPSVGLQGEYHWEASADLLDGCPIADAPGWLLEFKKPPAPAQAKAAGDLFMDAVVVASLKEALVFIPPDEYDLWVKVGQALKELGQQGFGLWAAWSQLSAKFEPRVMRPKWESFRPTEIHYQSIFSLAEQYGWVNSARNDQQDFDDLMRKAQRKTAAPTLEPVAPVVEDLRWPPSCAGLSEISDLLQTGGGVRHAAIGRAATLALLAYAAGRKYRTTFNDPLMLYQVLCAPSLAEIRHVKNTLFNLCRQAGLSGVKQMDLISPHQIYQKLHENPELLYINDKFVQQLRQAKRQPSGAQENALATLSDLYESDSVPLGNPADYGIKSDSKQVVIHAPALNWLAMLPDEQANELLCVSELSRGALNQYVFSYADPSQSIASEPQDIDWPPGIIERLQRVADQAIVSEFDGLVNHAEEPPNITRVRFETPPDAAYAEMMALSNHPLARNILLSARDQMRRIAAVLAVWVNPQTPVVTQELLDFAKRVELTSCREVLSRLKLMYSEDGKTSAAQKIMATIHRAGVAGITHQNLVRFCRSYKNLGKDERAKLMMQLIDDGDVAVLPNVNLKGERFISTDFVQQPLAKGDKGDTRETRFLSSVSPCEPTDGAG